MDEDASKVFRKRLAMIGLAPGVCQDFVARRVQSSSRLVDLQQRLAAIPEIDNYGGLCVYVAGSHARGDASVHSDVDLWFLRDDIRSVSTDKGFNIKTISLMSSVIKEIAAMNAPDPSNDGEYLKVLSLRDILSHLGGPQDDYKNNFTARMLLILESYPVYGEEVYGNALDGIIGSYMRDYEDHAENFRPTFLVNDVIRYWKTLCLNYEHRRNRLEDAGKVKQKIKNFKLGYSRLLTCFATITAFSRLNSVTKEELVLICRRSPVERLLSVAESQPSTVSAVASALTSYHWFLGRTEMSTEELEAYFSVRDNRVFAFKKAKDFGDQIFNLVKMVAEEAGTLRYLVV